MPVYHFTLHAYRSWRPDHPRGYTRRSKGYQKPNPEEAKRYDERANQDPAKFELKVRKLLIRYAHDFCQRRKFRLHGVGNEVGHVHFVMSWRGYSSWEEVLRRLKNILATTLNKELNTPGKRWFVRGASRKRVKNRAHLDHLLKTYLPSHPGPNWREGLAIS
jgi:REP element-mobilizing transposase RayT